MLALTGITASDEMSPESLGIALDTDMFSFASYFQVGTVADLVEFISDHIPALFDAQCAYLFLVESGLSSNIIAPDGATFTGGAVGHAARIGEERQLY